MLVLIGTKPGFGISEEWIIERAGITERAYIDARKALVARGWIQHKDCETITVDFAAIYAAAKPEKKTGKAKEKENPAERSGRNPAEPSGKAPAEPSGVLPAEQSDITNNTDTDRDKSTNKSEKKLQEGEKGPGSSPGEQPGPAAAQDQQPRKVSASSFHSLLAGGNKISWQDQEQGIFVFNGRLFQVER